jgi:aryl-alcohol dehydrogenase-like predicted oxidoreductase
MKRRVFVGGVLAGVSAQARPQRPAAGDIPTRPFGKTGVRLQVIAQGGARMDLHPTVAEAAAHVRGVYDLGLRYFDCARSYWGGKAEEAYGIGLKGVRQNVFLTSKSTQKTRAKAEEELAASLRALQTDHLDLWQIHDVRTRTSRPSSSRAARWRRSRPPRRPGSAASSGLPGTSIPRRTRRC